MSFECQVGDEALFQATLQDGNGNPVNLTGHTVQCRWKLSGGAYGTLQAATIVTPSAGTVSYRFLAADLTAPGTYFMQFKDTDGSGNTVTYPSNGALPFAVYDS